MSIDVLLGDIDSWFNEPGIAQQRSKLLSKLAILELCGWIEGRLDELVQNSAKACAMQGHAGIAEAIDKTFGFDYQENFRKLVVRVVGERGAGAVEERMELSHPGDLEQLKASLGMLRVVRGYLAHTSTVGTNPKQVTVNAPSWSINQQRIIARRIDRFEVELLKVSSAIHGSI